MAIFAQPTPDMNLVPGWDVQGNGNAGNPGPDAPGYGSVEASFNTNYGPGQSGAGVPFPPNTGNEGTNGAAAESVLVNPGYADGTGPGGRALGTGNLPSAPGVPASGSVAANPTGLVATVVISGGTLTQVKVGSAGQTYAQAAQAGTADGTYTVPPNGVIGTTNSVPPTWAWTV